MQSIRRRRGQSIVVGNGVTVEVKCIQGREVVLHVTGGVAARAENIDPRGTELTNSSEANMLPVCQSCPDSAVRK